MGVQIDLYDQRVPPLARATEYQVVTRSRLLGLCLTLFIFGFVLGMGAMCWMFGILSS